MTNLEINLVLEFETFKWKEYPSKLSFLYVEGEQKAEIELCLVLEGWKRKRKRNATIIPRFKRRRRSSPSLVLAGGSRLISISWDKNRRPRFFFFERERQREIEGQDRKGMKKNWKYKGRAFPKKRDRRTGWWKAIKL